MLVGFREPQTHPAPARFPGLAKGPESAGMTSEELLALEPSVQTEGWVECPSLQAALWEYPSDIFGHSPWTLPYVTKETANSSH